MWRVANVSARSLMLLIVGAVTFVGTRATGAVLALQIAALTLACAAVVPAAAGDALALSRGRYGGVMPYALALVAVACGAASATRGGGALVVAGVMTMVVSASSAPADRSWYVPAAGIGATEALGVALHAGTTTTIYYPALLLLGFVFGHNMRAYRVQADQAAQLKAEHARVATLDERARLAREVHDVLAHALGALTVQLQVTRAVLAEQQDMPRALALLDQAQRMAADGLTETRRAVKALRGETQALPEALQNLAVTHQRRHGARVTVEISGAPRALSPDAGLALTRTAQEALVNAAKYAPREAVELDLDYGAGTTTLVVRNRVGPVPRAPEDPPLATVNGGYGLAGLRERLLLIDGTLSAGQERGEWVVLAMVPQ